MASDKFLKFFLDPEVSVFTYMLFLSLNLASVTHQVKAFVVKTIQFRNSFDTEGPLVPGLLPSEAVSRLGLSE